MLNRIKFGVNPIAWSNDDMQELGAETSLQACLTDVASLGFAGIELGHKFPRQQVKLQPILDAFGLQLVSGWYSAGLLNHSAEQEIENMQSHLKLLKAMGCKVMIFAETSNAIHGDQTVPINQQPVLEEKQWQQFGQRLNKVAHYLISQGMQMAYHYHMGTVVQTSADLQRFFQVTDKQVGVVLDTGHGAMAGVDGIQIIRHHRERIVHVHCKDIRQAVVNKVLGKNMSFLQGVVAGMFTVPGDGDINFAAIIAELNKINYKGWLVIEAEQDPAKANPKAYAEQGLSALKKLCAQT